MTIKEVSQKMDISADTLRYYERVGLIPSVKRNKSGTRDYDEEDLRWIQFAKCMRQSGLSIESLVEYLKLFLEGEHTCEARRELLLEEREKLLARIESMNETLERLNYKIENYDKILKQQPPKK